MLTVFTLVFDASSALLVRATVVSRLSYDN
jgi:hypothetical protein